MKTATAVSPRSRRHRTLGSSPRRVPRTRGLVLGLLALALAGVVCSSLPAAPKPEKYWQVDDLRAGMKGQGLTVMKGTKVETFQAEVLGVLKNTSPGRDLVLCRLSGLDLEKTGVIAGMSGSPVYFDGKLAGAVAYAWAFGKEPIAGVTPFSQMHDFVEWYERRDMAEQEQPRRIGLRAPVRAGGQEFDTVTVASSCSEPLAAGADSLWMLPLRTPVAATGFTPHSLALLKDCFQHSGMVPMQGGAANSHVAEEAKDAPLQPGSPLAVALVRGDFDLSGIGTVTHIEDKRVYGWGHPFFGLGACEFPLSAGYIHAICPRQNISFKIGSPLTASGVINADVSTGIAGWLDRKADMLPVRMTVGRESGSSRRSFQVEVARQRSMLSSLVFTVLTNAVDMEGELPEELTAELQAKIEVEGRPAIVIKDTFSGSSYSGGRAPQALYSHVTRVVNLLAYNAHKPVRLESIECDTRILAGRRSADIEAIELDSEVYSPGETLKATVFVQPYKGLRQRLPVALPLPPDLPEGSYTATVCDDLANADYTLRDNPNWKNPQNLEHVFEALQLLTSVQRTSLVVRVPIPGAGVALEGKSLPQLPPSMVQILGTSRRTGVQTMGTALMSRQGTSWVVQGSESVRFTVTKNKKVGSRQ